MKTDKLDIEEQILTLEKRETSMILERNILKKNSSTINSEDKKKRESNGILIELYYLFKENQNTEELHLEAKLTFNPLEKQESLRIRLK